jgi:hypothetical protein
MTDQSKALRRYSEKEIGRILERATELQQAEPGSGAAGGLTLAELEEIAAEAAIDVRHLRRAAREVETGARGPTPWSRVLGEDLAVTRETVLPGEVPEKGFEELLGVLQSTVRDPGRPSLLGRNLSWDGGSEGSRRLRVVISSRDGETSIQVEETYGQIAGGLFGGVGGGVGFGVGMGVGIPAGLEIGSAVAAFGLPVAILGLTYFCVRGLYRRIVRGRRRVLDELFDRLVVAAQDAIAERALGPS